MAAVPIGNKNVGDTIKIKENGVLKDYIIIHKGLPSSLYDASCNGVWVLRKLLYPYTWGVGWNTSNGCRDYEKSSVHTWLNGTFYNLLDTGTKACIKQVKIPNVNADGVKKTGASGIVAKCFLLSACECGISSKYLGLNTQFTESSRLSYFNEYTGSNGNNTCRDTDFDKSDGTATTGHASWYCRTVYEISGSVRVAVVGSWGTATASEEQTAKATGTRPAMVIDSSALVADDGTLIMNTAPGTPGSISVPGSINGGSTITVSWGASTDAQGNLEGYKLERSTDSGVTWSQIYQGGGTSTANNVAYGTQRVMYRVKAYDSAGLESGYRTSGNVAVINNTAPGTPAGITVPADVKGGSTITVSWGASTDAENNLSGYELERSVGGGSWSQVYRGASRSFADSITRGWTTVAYRVRAYDSQGAYSGYSASAVRAVDNNTAPVISCSAAADMGEKAEGFSIAYSVTDAENDRVTVTESVDGAAVRSYAATLGAENTFELGGMPFQKLLNGNHTVTFTASDGKISSVRSLVFTKKVNEASVTLEAPLEADAAITVCALSVSGYIPEDADFTVEAANNAADETPEWEDCTHAVRSGANYIFKNTEAQNGPAFSFRLSVKRGVSGEGGFITSVQGGFQ